MPHALEFAAQRARRWSGLRSTAALPDRHLTPALSPIEAEREKRICVRLRPSASVCVICGWQRFRQLTLAGAAFEVERENYFSHVTLISFSSGLNSGSPVTSSAFFSLASAAAKASARLSLKRAL